MSMIYLAGKYLNLDNVTEIIDGIDKVIMIEFVGGTRDYLAENSPEAAALRHHLRKVSVEVEAAYQSHIDQQERLAKINAWQKRFLAFAEEKNIPKEVTTDEAGYYPRIPRDEYQWFLQGENDVSEWDEANEETYAAFLEQQEQNVHYRSISF